MLTKFVLAASLAAASANAASLKDLVKASLGGESANEMDVGMGGVDNCHNKCRALQLAPLRLHGGVYRATDTLHWVTGPCR